MLTSVPEEQPPAVILVKVYEDVPSFVRQTAANRLVARNLGRAAQN